MNPILAYRKKHNISRQDFAERVKRAYETVRRWEFYLRAPAGDDWVLIAEVTNGEVTPNDFYGIGGKDA